MGLYPHQSRRKRFETAATAALLYLTIVGLLVAFLLAGQDTWEWRDLKGFSEVAIGGVLGLFALIAYVRGVRR